MKKDTYSEIQNLKDEMLSISTLRPIKGSLFICEHTPSKTFQPYTPLLKLNESLKKKLGPILQEREGEIEKEIKMLRGEA